MIFPTLIQLGPLAVTSLGFFLFLSFFVASYLIWQKGREENFDAEPLMDAVILGTLSCFIGSRLLYIFTQKEPAIHFFNFFKFPGFSYFGALTAGLLFIIYYCYRMKWSIWKTLEVIIFGIVPAQILIRIGNFLDGSFSGRTKIPVSLYEIIFLVVLYYLIKKLERQYRLFDWYKNKRSEAQPGFLFLVYLTGYAIFRFPLEFLMPSSLYFKGLGWEQWLAGLIFLAGLILFYERSGRGWENIIGALKSLKPKPKSELPVLSSSLNWSPKKRMKERPYHIKAGMEASKDVH